MLIAVTTGFLTLTPTQFFSNPYYWAGLGLFGILGAFVYGSTKKGSKLPRYGKYAFVATLAVAIGLAPRFPNAIAFGFGFIGFLIGLAIKSTYAVLFDTRVAFCPLCGEVVGLSKREGKWYCNRQGHEVI